MTLTARCNACFLTSQTLGSLFRIPLQAWLFAFFCVVLSCVGEAFCLADPPSKERYQIYKSIKNFRRKTA